MKTWILLVLLLTISGTALAEALKSHVGNFYPFLKAYAGRSEFALSFLSRDWPDPDTWRAQGRAKMRELLAYEAAPAPRDAEILATVKEPGYTRHHVRYSVTADRKTEAFLLVPAGLKGRAPAVVAIHDHGGFYYFGKEKITKTDIRSAPLSGHIRSAYGGRTYADELARRGFVVLVPDGFYFGSQRLDPGTVPDKAAGRLLKLEPDSDDYVRAFNRFASKHEEVVAKTLFTSGTTWPGVLFQGDRASVDYLLTRPDDRRFPQRPSVRPRRAGQGRRRGRMDDDVRVAAVGPPTLPHVDDLRPGPACVAGPAGRRDAQRAAPADGD